SLSYCELSTKGENVKVYLSFAQVENKEEIINLINKKYSPLVKKEMAKSKKFAYLPNLVFLLDKELETINNLEKILQKLILLLKMKISEILSLSLLAAFFALFGLSFF